MEYMGGGCSGGIPPLMGWTAGGGHLLPTAYSFETFLPSFLNATSSIPPPLEAIDNPLSVLALFAVLFSWQFPHFNSLSYLSRACYAQAGYHMLSVTNPSKNALVSLRHAALLVPICSVLVPLSGLTTWWFALSSLIPNAIALRAAWQYWKKGTDKYARKVFHHSLWYLPVVLGLMMFHKQGMEWLRWLGWKPILIERIDRISDPGKDGSRNL
ncbi:hypothetical protein BS47DRAFT_1437146 [Hydnum rufescens UP504]|uniref:Heme O synthase n=1 Tax=Hydnum rufescens UP504 TaxID=1448309 RepID=A0A9P6B4V4_9AGAM|nr:hypothetical protein BS47DRAFT_1437146 [Hydnum rufescens UP504]